MFRFFCGLIGFVAGGVLLGAAGTWLGEIYVDLANVSKMEGGAGFMVLFLFTTPGIIIGMILGAVLASRWAGRMRPRPADAGSDGSA